MRFTDKECAKSASISFSRLNPMQGLTFHSMKHNRNIIKRDMRQRRGKNNGVLVGLLVRWLVCGVIVCIAESE